MKMTMANNGAYFSIKKTLLLVFFFIIINAGVYAYNLNAVCDESIIAGKTFSLKIYYTDNAGNKVEPQESGLLTGIFTIRTTGDDSALDRKILSKTGFIDNVLDAELIYKKSGVISLIVIDQSNGLVTRTNSITVMPGSFTKINIAADDNLFFTAGAQYEIKLSFADNNNNRIALNQLFNNRKLNIEDFFINSNDTQLKIVSVVSGIYDLSLRLYTETAGLKRFVITDKLSGTQMADSEVFVYPAAAAKIDMLSDSIGRIDGYNIEIIIKDAFGNIINNNDGTLKIIFTDINNKAVSFDAVYEKKTYLKDSIKIMRAGMYEIECIYTAGDLALSEKKRVNIDPGGFNNVIAEFIKIEKPLFVIKSKFNFTDINGNEIISANDNIKLEIDGQYYFIEKEFFKEYYLLNTLRGWKNIKAEASNVNIKQINKILLIKNAGLADNYNLIFCFSGAPKLDTALFNNKKELRLNFSDYKIGRNAGFETDDKFDRIIELNDALILSAGREYIFSDIALENINNIAIVNFNLKKADISSSRHIELIKNFSANYKIQSADLTNIFDLRFDRIKDLKLKEKLNRLN